MQKINHQNYLLLLIRLVKQFLANGGIINASALTYTTLFAVVPLMTVSYAVLAMIPSFQGVGQEIQHWVFSNFVPATGEVVQNYLADFTSQARRLTAVGAIFLFVTSVMMMKNIEAAFNRIWRVKESRKGMSSFLLYWAVLSLGPILIGVGLLLSSYIASISIVSDAAEVLGRGRILSLLPVLLSIAAFTLLYAAVPNCRVPFKNAFIGAIVVAILFEIAKRGFAFFAIQFPSYELIYGAFAAVPLFLAWIFITWIIILLGAELTRMLTVYNPASHNAYHSELHTIVGVLKELWQAQLSGASCSDEYLLNSVGGLNQQNWDEYQQILLTEDVICRTEQGSYLLARNLDTFTLEQLTLMLPWPLPMPEGNEQNESSHSELLNQTLRSIQKEQHLHLDIPMKKLFD